MRKVKNWTQATEKDFMLAKELIHVGLAKNKIADIIGKSSGTISKWERFDSLEEYRAAMVKENTKVKPGQVILPDSDKSVEQMITMYVNTINALNQLMTSLNKLIDTLENSETSKKLNNGW